MQLKGLVQNMRLMEFKMERQNLVEIGQKVEVVERSCPANYHYIIKPAVAMSGCVAVGDRLTTLEGVVKDIKHNAQGYYVIVEFPE